MDMLNNTAVLYLTRNAEHKCTNFLHTVDNYFDSRLELRSTRWIQLLSMSCQCLVSRYIEIWHQTTPKALMHEVEVVIWHQVLACRRIVFLFRSMYSKVDNGVYTQELLWWTSIHIRQLSNTVSIGIIYDNGLHQFQKRGKDEELHEILRNYMATTIAWFGECELSANIQHLDCQNDNASIWRRDTMGQPYPWIIVICHHR